MGQKISLDPGNLDDPVVYKDQFNDERVRKNFVSKVYGILTVQMVFSSAVIFGLTYDEEIREWIYDREWISFITGGVGAAVYMMLACCESVRRSFPINCLFLIIMTVSYAATAGCAAARYEIFVVYMAFFGTGIITIVMTLFAKFAPCDITGCGPLFCVLGIAIVIFGIGSTVVSIFVFAPILHLLFAGVVVVFLSLYLIFLTQMILGGKREQIAPNEVILAVIILYVTIIDIFIYLLAIIEACFGE